MTTQEKLIKRKQSLLELAEYLQNISHACKIHVGHTGYCNNTATIDNKDSLFN